MAQVNAMYIGPRDYLSISALDTWMAVGKELRNVKKQNERRSI